MIKTKVLIIVYFILFSSNAFCKNLKQAAIEINGITILAEVADSDSLRIKGLSKRNNLDENKGMLFIFNDSSNVSFWMKDTFIPLSIAFINSDREIIEIHDMTPLSLERIISRVPCTYALEVNKGWFKKYAIKPGMKVNLNLKKIEASSK